MSGVATESLRDLRDAFDAAEHDRANDEPGSAFAARYNRSALEKLAPDLAADLIDAREALCSIADAAHSERECEASVSEATTECERLLSSRSRTAFDSAKADLVARLDALADARRVLRERLDALLAIGGAR